MSKRKLVDMLFIVIRNNHFTHLDKKALVLFIAGIVAFVKVYETVRLKAGFRSERR
jgi:hypothetical protein